MGHYIIDFDLWLEHPSRIYHSGEHAGFQRTLNRVSGNVIRERPSATCNQRGRIENSFLGKLPELAWFNLRPPPSHLTSGVAQSHVGRHHRFVNHATTTKLCAERREDHGK